MARFQLMPFNSEGELVKRAASSIKETASREEVAERVAQCAGREGVGRIVHVEVYDASKLLVSAWDVRADCVVQTDGVGSEHFKTARIPAKTWSPENQVTIHKENEMANETAEGIAAAAAAKGKAATAKAPKEPKAPKAPKEPKGPNKKEQALELLKQKGGTTLEEIAKKVNVSTAAARALVGDCQRMQGVTIKRDKVDGVSKYSA